MSRRKRVACWAFVYCAYTFFVVLAAYALGILLTTSAVAP